MGSEDSALSTGSDCVNVITEKKKSGRKKSGKLSRKIHKAEREKQKRGHMNVLFLELGKTLEQAQPNQGKASILNDSIRLLRDLLNQIDCLKRENAALISESDYVTIEKNDLQEENTILKTQVEKLQNEIEEKAQANTSGSLGPQAQMSCIAPPQQLQLEDQLVLPAVKHHGSQPGPVLGPVIIVPLHQGPQAYPNHDPVDAEPRLPSNISKPRARYPSSSDSWPSDLIERTKSATDAQHDIQHCTNS